MKKAININVCEIEEKINYTFKDKSLLIQAFTRTSYCNEINSSAKVKYHSNEVLEFFGDGVLSLSIISFLLKECTERYEHGIRTELNEGDFSNIKSKLSDKQNLSKSMKALGLERYLLMGEGDIKLGIQNEPSVMEDLFESIVGAIFIDSGMNIGAVINSVSSMLDMSVYTSRQRVAQSAKNALQEWCADKRHRLPAPRYETISEDGPDHKKTYMRACYIGDRLVGRGIGKNFKLADAAAAEDALKALMAQEQGVMQSKVVTKEDIPSRVTDPAKQQKGTTEPKAPKSTPAAQQEQTQTDIAKKATGAATLLKSYAAAKKISSPVFKDLGEKKNGQVAVCSVECSFAGEVAIGTGATRSEAREASCRQMAEKLGILKKKTPAKKPVPAPQKKDDGAGNKSGAPTGTKASSKTPRATDAATVSAPKKRGRSNYKKPIKKS